MRPASGPHDDALVTARPFVDQDDIDAVAAALRATTGRASGAVTRFEAQLGQACGAPHAVAVASAAAGLQLAYHVLGAGPGRAVWLSANAPRAAASAAQLCGSTPEFLDIDLARGNVDLRALEQRLDAGARPALVTAVHFAGLPCDMEWLLALKRRHDFALVEDASEALGARYRVEGRWFRPGEHPEVDATVLSFHAEGHVTTAEGGAVLTHEAERAARLVRARGQGTDPEANVLPFDGAGAAAGARKPAWFEPMLELGFHCALTEMQAALGSGQLAKLPEFLGARREIAHRYLAELRGYELPHPGGRDARGDEEHAWGRFVLRCAPGERDELMLYLRRAGIGTEVCHYPLPLEPWLRARGGARAFPNAVAHARSAMSLPLHPALSDAEQGRVIAALSAWRRAHAAA